MYAVARALASSVVKRADADWQHHAWAIANVVYGVSAALSYAAAVSAPAQAAEVGLSEIAISELDLEEQVLGKMVRVVGQHNKAELASMGSRVLRDLSAAFASALASPRLALRMRVTQPTAMAIATVVGLLCQAAALVPEVRSGEGGGISAHDRGGSIADAAVSQGRGRIPWGWSTMDAALTLRHGAAVAEALDSLLLSSASLRVSLIGLGDVTLSQFELQMQRPRVRVAAAAGDKVE